MSCLPCSTPAPRVSKVEPLVQWPVAKCSRQGGPDWPRHASGRLRGTQPQPAVLPGCRDAADPDTCQLPRVLPQQARGPLHPLESRCQLEREFPQDQREGSGGQRAGGSEGRTAEPAAWGGAGPFQLTSAPQENEKSPSQNRKAKDATSDNGKDGLAYSALLKNELLGACIEKVQDPQTEDRRLQPSTPEKKGLFTVSLPAAPPLAAGPCGDSLLLSWTLAETKVTAGQVLCD